MAFGIFTARSKYDTEISTPRSVYLAFDVPFMGTLDVTWNGATQGRTWLDTAGIVSEPMNGGVEVWAGRLHIAMGQDTSIRPDLRTVALAAFAVAEVVRWCW